MILTCFEQAQLDAEQSSVNLTLDWVRAWVEKCPESEPGIVAIAKIFNAGFKSGQVTSLTSLVGNSSTVNFNFYGETQMGDKYQAGQAAAMGPKATAKQNVFQQSGQQIIDGADVAGLMDGLSDLAKLMNEKAKTPHEHISLGYVKAAQADLQTGNQESALTNLREAAKKGGEWLLDLTKQVGVAVLTKVITG